MTSFKNSSGFIKRTYQTHGVYKTAISVLYKILNRLFNLNCLMIISLNKDDYKKRESADLSTHVFKNATENDIRELTKTNEFDIYEQDLKALKNGEQCLLHYVGDELAGYTWAHLSQSPTIIDGIRLKIPQNTIYNYKGFTHPKFRGKGLQSIRYQLLFDNYAGNGYSNLLGYVFRTNWSSRKGQRKGGYRDIGPLYYMKAKNTIFVLLSKKLVKAGIGLTSHENQIKRFYALKR